MYYPAKPTTFHAANFYRFSEPLLRSLYELFDEFNISVKPIILGFTMEKLSKGLVKGRSIHQLYLNNVRLFQYIPGDKGKKWVESAADRERRLFSRVRKQFEEAADQGSNNRDRTTGVRIATDKLKERLSRHRKMLLNHFCW